MSETRGRGPYPGGEREPTPVTAAVEQTPAVPQDAIDTKVVGAPQGDLEPATRAAPQAELPREAFREDTGLRAFDLLANYQILRKLGGGGMAEVYLARSALGAGVDKLVAFKTARPAFGPDTKLGALFLNEARVSASLAHPNIVQVFDFGEAAGRPFLAMEYVHGRELQTLIRRVMEGLPLPVNFVVAVLVAVCRALEYVHARKALDGSPLNLVHRDVSPSNVLISADGQVKLMDFGVAAAHEGPGGLVVGKATYMPPEQAAGGKAQPAWDVYATGAIGVELLSVSRFGTAPTGGTVEHVAELETIARRATALDPRLRYSSARELREELERLQSALPPVDLAATMTELFGPELEVEQNEIERLVQEARGKSRSLTLPRVLRPLLVLRRRVAATRGAMWLAARPAVMFSVLAAAVLVAGGATAWVWSVQRAESAFTERIQRADARIAAGRLVGPGGDQALDLLVAAREDRPKDLRVQRRLAMLAQTFERLGDAALSRGDHAEAAAHLQAALQAEPGRTTAAAKLREVEAVVREQARARLRRSGRP